MGSNASQREKRAIFSRPRPLEPSEIALLRQDAISTSSEMKSLIVQRGQRQQQTLSKLVSPPLAMAAE